MRMPAARSPGALSKLKNGRAARDGAKLLAMASGPRYSSPASGETAFQPHPDDMEEVRSAIEEADRGELLSAEKSEAYLRWLETGEGPCPVSLD